MLHDKLHWQCNLLGDKTHLSVLLHSDSCSVAWWMSIHGSHYCSNGRFLVITRWWVSHISTEEYDWLIEHLRSRRKEKHFYKKVHFSTTQLSFKSHYHCLRQSFQPSQTLLPHFSPVLISSPWMFKNYLQLVSGKLAMCSKSKCLLSIYFPTSAISFPRHRRI